MNKYSWIGVLGLTEQATLKNIGEARLGDVQR